MITATNVLKMLQEQDDMGTDKDSDSMTASTGAGGEDNHTHTYDPKKSGRTSMVNGHDHGYTVGDDITGPANDEEGEHVHALPENDDLEA